MRHKCEVAAISTAVLLAFTTSVLTSNRENFEFEGNLAREKIIHFLSTVLCSIDTKFANIYFELESMDSVLDGIIAETSSCISPSIKINAYEKETADILISTNSGTRLIIVLMRELELEKSILPKLFRIRQKQSFNLFYIIVSEIKLSSDHENLLKIMYWSYNLLNAVVVATDMDNVDLGPSVISYNPFKNETIRIPNNAYKREELFVKKDSNIFGSPINVVMYKDLVTTLTRRKGSKVINFNYDFFLPDLISSAMNATLILKNPFTKDSKVEDMNNADLTINGKYFSVEALQEAGIEATITMRRDDICIFLPYNRLRNTLNILYRTVDPFVWMMMIVVIFQVWISLFVVRWAQRYKACKHVFLFDLFGFHMNQALARMPKTAGPRLIIASCLMYCLVIKSIFEGLLFTSMVRDEDTRISTIDELLAMNQHEILVSNIFYNYTEYFLNDSPIKSRFEVVDFSEYIKRVDSNEIHNAYVGRKKGAKFFANTHVVEGLPVFYVMEECIVPHMTLYFARRGSPFLNRINQLLRLAEESGLFDYWEKQLSNTYNKVKQNQQIFARHSAIDLELLDFVFQIWSYGLAIAVVIFIIEWYGFRLKGVRKVGL